MPVGYNLPHIVSLRAARVHQTAYSARIMFQDSKIWINRGWLDMKISSILAVSAALSLGFSLQAQVAGRVTGTVVDATGVRRSRRQCGPAIARQRIECLRHDHHGDRRLQHSDCQPRNYDLVIEAKGFLKVKIAGVKVNPNRATDVPRSRSKWLPLRKRSKSPTAKESVETSSAEVSTTIAKSQIQNLPVLNRSPLGFLQTQAGINSGAAPRP